MKITGVAGHLSSPRKQKLKTALSIEKMMAAVF